MEGFDDEGGSGMEMSSENMDMSWSSSRRSKGGGACRRAEAEAAAAAEEEEELRHSSENGVSRKAMESLMDLR